MKINREISVEILSIGMAPFTMQIASSLVHGLLNKKLIVFGGDYAVGAMGIVNSVLSLIIMTIVAINMASQPIIGFNYGAKSVHRVKETLRISLIAATLISIAAFIFIESIPGTIVRLFNSDSIELYNISVHGLRLAVMLFPFVGFQVVASNFFQAIGKARFAMFATLFRQVIALLPLLFILPEFWGITGIWLAFPFSDLAAAIVVAVMLVIQWRKLPQSAG